MVIQGYLIGFTAAATLGPIALLTIQRTLKDGWRIGLVSGLGIALADGLYGLAGALGMVALTSLLVDYQVILRVAGGLVLVFIGIKAARTKEASLPGGEASQSLNLLVVGVGIFLLTLSNPMTILFFSAVFAGISTGDVAAPIALNGSPGSFAAGVFAGSFTWWVVLSGVVYGLRERFRLEQLDWLNRVSGLAIAGFGVWVIIQAFGI